jgi:hypothetical protein
MEKADLMQRLRQTRLFKKGHFEAYFALGFLVGAIGLFYAPIITGAATFWGGDLTEFTFPVYSALAHAIRTLDFSSLIWNPNIFNGFPLLAEGQIGAFYPMAWLTLPWLPTLYALNLTIVLSFLIGALATCWFSRLIGLNWPSAIFAAFVFAFNGFATAHLTHVPLIQGLPWLPIILCLVELAFKHKNLIYTLLAGLAWGTQWLAGHPQMAFMTMILVAMYAIYRSVIANRKDVPLPKRLSVASTTVIAIGVIGCAIASVYLLPLLELGTLSIRPNARLSYEEIVAYSLPFRNLLTAIIPFLFGGAQGDYWGLWNLAEVGFYVGVPTLVLAVGSLIFSRPKSTTLFFAFAAVVSLVLALGGNTPLYRLLSALPVFSSLRAPARFVYLLVFCLAILAGTGLNALSNVNVSRVRVRLTVGLAVVAILAGVAVCSGSLVLHNWLTTQSLSISTGLPGWITSGAQDPATTTYYGLLRATDPRSIYTYLPALFLVLSGAMLLLHSRLPIRLWPWIGVILLVVDLWFYSTRMPSSSRFPPEYASSRLPALDFVASQTSPDRTFSIRTHQPSATMEALRYEGLIDTGGYTPLQLRRNLLFKQLLWGWETYQPQNLLNAMGARYIVDSINPTSPGNLHIAGKVQFVPSYPIAIVGDQGMAQHLVYNVPHTITRQVEFVSSLEGPELHGTPEVVQMTLVDSAGVRHPLSLRANIHTAYRRPTTPASVQGSQTLKAVSAVPLDNTGTVGYSYHSSMTLQLPITVTSLELDYVAPVGQFRLLGLSLVGDQGQVTELSPYMRDTYRLIYADKTSTVYENKQVLPHAYTVHTVHVVNGEGAALSALGSPDFAPAREVILEDTRAPIPSSSSNDASGVRMVDYSPMRITLDASMQADGYLVLSDTNYPGWKCEVDGMIVPIYQANYLFRAVYLPTGNHKVTFYFEPTALWTGTAISLGGLIITLVAICGLSIWKHRTRVSI